MCEPALQAQIDAARAYETLFVPALFREWAPRVADAAQIKAGQRVLDVACGTGALAREAASRTGPSGSVSGIDPGVGMLAVARELAPTIDWRHRPRRRRRARECRDGLLGGGAGTRATAPKRPGC